MSPNINPDYVITLQGQEYCTYRGVLDRAHALGLEGIRTRILQIPGPDNDYVAIVEAEVRMKDGRVFTDVADASPTNVHVRLASALIRMASTRAKGRALRDAVNIGEALAEELPDLQADAVVEGREAAARPRTPSVPVSMAPAKPAPAPSAAAEAAGREGAVVQMESTAVRETTPQSHTGFERPAATGVPGDPAAEAPPAAMVCSNPDCGRAVTQGQYNYSLRAYGAVFCPACQRRQPTRGKSP